jgi:hypothetical protein
MQGTVSACLGLPIGCMNFLFPKEFITIFGLGYYPLQTAPYLLMKNLMKHQGQSSQKGFSIDGNKLFENSQTIESLAEKHDLLAGTCLNLLNSF